MVWSSHVPCVHRRILQHFSSVANREVLLVMHTKQRVVISFQAFQKLVGLLNTGLLINQEMASLCGGAIRPELRVYITLWYLAG